MSLWTQMAAGTLLLMVCSGLQLVIFVIAVGMLKQISTWLGQPRRRHHWGILSAVAFTAVIVAHSIQVWLWAASFMAMSALPTLEEALYFSLSSYTTVGYGDVIVGEGYRIFASMGAVTGFLNFGLSTAFLVGLFSRMIPDGMNRI